MCVQVGGLHDLPGPIDDVTTYGDCIIVTIKEDGNGKAAGTFYSQAIMNKKGAVAAWTLWQRVPGGDKKTLQVLPRIGEFSFLYTAGPEQFLHVQTTAWYATKNVTKDAPIAFDMIQDCVEKQFQGSDLFGITDYPATMRGISGHDTLSMFIALGVQKIVLMQTSECDERGILHPFKGSYNKLELHDGSLKGISAAYSIRALSITGGALTTCGALSCSAIGTHADQAWLFVGGSSGLAVLARKDGSGWSAQSGIRNGFGALDDDFVFKNIGNYTFIRKIICCGNYLYVLTNSSLDRILLTQKQFNNTATIAIEHLINDLPTLQGKKLYLNDLIVSPDVLLLATTDGLCAGIPGNPMSLQKINLPGAQQPIINLSVVSRTGHENDFAYAGQVYVVARSCNYRETYIYRLFVDASRSMHDVHDAIDVMYDGHNKGEFSYWLHYLAPQQSFVTDGITSYSYCSRLKNQQPHVSYLPASDVRSKSIMKEAHITHLPLIFEKTHSAIRAMIRNSATGSWLVAGDFGLRVNK